MIICNSELHFIGDPDVINEDRTKEQLISKLAELRRQNAELSAALNQTEFGDMKSARKYVQDFFDSSLDMIIIVDKDRLITEFNEAAQRAFGYKLSEVLGKYVDMLYDDPREGLEVHRLVRETGQFSGEPFAGGRILNAEPYSGLSKGYEYITPNLTPDKETGIMAFWSEKDFIRRFKSGRIHVGSPMPWEAFAVMDETDLKALYRYLRSLDPIQNKIERVYR